MCFPCTSHSMREEATTSIFSATYGLNSSQKVEIRENLCPGYWRGWFPQLPVSAYAPMQHPAPAAVTNRCNYTGSRVQCPPAAGAGAVAQFGGVSAAPSPQPSPAQLPPASGGGGRHRHDCHLQVDLVLPHLNCGYLISTAL